MPYITAATSSPAPTMVPPPFLNAPPQKRRWR
jgi:hypothetical protein